MRIRLTYVLVDDQAKAEHFYTDILGFTVKDDVPLGEYRWLTVVSPDEPEAAELLLEPDAHPAAKAFKEAMRGDGLPVATFAVDDLAAEHARLVSLAFSSRWSPPRWAPSPSPSSTTPAATSSS